MEKLKQDYQKGLTNETKITLPSVKFFTGGAASQAGNESGFNPKISEEKKNAKSLSSILDFLNKTQEADSCSKVKTDNTYLGGKLKSEFGSVIAIFRHF